MFVRAYRRHSLRGSVSSPVCPLQPGRLDETRSGLHGAGHEVDRGADAEHGHRQPVAMLQHPALLFRTAERDEEDANAGTLDGSHLLLVFLGRERTERRREAIRDVEVREPGLEPLLDVGEHLRSAPVQAHGQTVPHGQLADVQHDVQATGLLRAAVAGQPAEPQQRTPVAEHQIRGRQPRRERRVVPRLHDHVDVGGADDPADALLRPALHDLGGLARTDRQHAGGEDSPGRDPHAGTPPTTDRRMSA